MTSIKYMFGVLILLLFTASFVAAADPQRESQVVITPASEDGSLINVSVYVFNPAVSTGGESARDVMEEIVQDCGGDQTCIMEEGLARMAASEGFQFGLETLPNAKIEVTYYDIISGKFIAVPGCEQLYTNLESTQYLDTADGQIEVPYYHTQCDITPAVGGQSGRTTIVAHYYPTEADNAKGASTLPYYFSNVDVTPATQFTQILNNIIKSLSEQGIVGGLPCIGIFLIMGLLLSSLYFAGKSPVSLLDITTPRLPQPKGVAAGGQVLMPFGYTEMKRTVGKKAAAAVGAMGVFGRQVAKTRAGDKELSNLKKKIDGLKGTKADEAAGDVNSQKEILKGLATLGREMGYSEAELAKLVAALPYHNLKNPEFNRMVEEILEKAMAKGGRHALAANTLKDYFLGQRTMQSLEALTGHIDVGKRSRIHHEVTGRLGKAFGPNRYAVIGGFVGSGYDSIVRTGRVSGRMTKAMVTHAPDLARSATRTTMEMVGGKRAVEQMEARAKTSAVAGWLSKKKKSDLVIGQMFPVNDKMGHLYRTLKDEAIHDEMRYVLKQLYKKLGIKFDISERELAEMGYVDMDILKRSGYKGSKELAAIEKELKAILANGGLNSQQKLDKLIQLAEARGAVLDHNMLSFSQRITAIDQSDNPEYVKLLLLQKELEHMNAQRVAMGMLGDDTYLCHVGGDSLRGSQIWETMVLRTMIWDAEHGHLNGGIQEELLSARLNVANRIATLDPSSAMSQLPEHMRNAGQLQAVAERNRKDLVSLFSEEGKRMFEQTNGKSIKSASISEIVSFMYGGGTPKTGHIDKKTGKMVWWEADEELSLSKSATLVDMKRHWIAGLDPADNIAIGQWVQSRFTKSYVPPHDASIEAQLDRTAGSANWGIDQRSGEAKKLWVADQLRKDMEQRFNSHFGQNTYGTTRETIKFYAGIMAGNLEKALLEKGLSNNHPDMVFMKGMDLTNAKHIDKLSKLVVTNEKAYNEVMKRPVTYDDIAKSNKAVVMLYEGGFAYHHKNMMLSDQDRVLGGEVALRDNNGQLRKFIPEDIPINFAGRDDLMREFNRVSRSANPQDWDNFISAATKWAKEGGYNYDREKVLGATLWQYANATYDYDRFWRNSAASVEAKHKVTNVAPSPLRFFGADAPGLASRIQPYRDMGTHAGDYISKVALSAGGALHKVSYDITPVSEYYKQHSWHLASQIMSGRGMEGLTQEEKLAYQNVAMQHHGYHQVWDFAIDRNPWRHSTSFGSMQSWGSFFHFGPAQQYSVKDNLRAYMDRGEYYNFMAGQGFAMGAAKTLMRPYTNMIRGLQMSMQGYASKWDQTGNALRQWNYTQPRIQEAMQSINPFSFRWFPGKTGERIASLNKFGGSLEQHQLAGPEFMGGLKQAPQDIFLNKKGTYATARTGAANPGSSYYNYRHELQLDAPMAEYMMRTKEAAFIYDKKVQEAAYTNTTRRTVSAEALAIRRDQEVRGFGVEQNPLHGWANPISFVWHVPIPGYPTGATPRDIVSNFVSRAKGYGGRGFSDSVRAVSQNISRGTSRMMQPHRMHMTVYCSRCSKPGYRGSRCACGTHLY